MSVFLQRLTLTKACLAAINVSKDPNIDVVERLQLIWHRNCADELFQCWQRCKFESAALCRRRPSTASCWSVSSQLNDVQHSCYSCLTSSEMSYSKQDDKLHILYALQFSETSPTYTWQVKLIPFRVLLQSSTYKAAIIYTQSAHPPGTLCLVCIASKGWCLNDVRRSNLGDAQPYACTDIRSAVLPPNGESLHHEDIYCVV